MILATGENNEIGIGSKLPWYIPEDLKYFKEKTINSVVVMGSRTFYSLKFNDGLSNRDNIVLSRSEGHNRDGVQFIDNIQWVLDLELELPDNDIWIIGGAQVYTLFKDYVGEVHWTQVKKTVPSAEVFFDTSWFNCSNDWMCTKSKKLTDEAKVFVYKKI